MLDYPGAARSRGSRVRANEDRGCGTFPGPCCAAARKSASNTACDATLLTSHCQPTSKSATIDGDSVPGPRSPRIRVPFLPVVLDGELIEEAPTARHAPRAGQAFCRRANLMKSDVGSTIARVLALDFVE